MASASELIESAFARLSERDGFVDRPDQRQLSLLISDCLEGGVSGAFEAPTGLGKSLAALIPAIAWALAEKKKVVIATYTNILAEQYWRKDLPLAMSLFDEKPRTSFLIGRQRYACLAALDELGEDLRDAMIAHGELGTEPEFREIFRGKGREIGATWSLVVTPPVCAGKLCPHFMPCFYYSARRKSDQAQVIITNHNVVLQDAQSKAQATNGLLPAYDLLILDEAHDFPSAAMNALEFELSESKLNITEALAAKAERNLENIAVAMRQREALRQLGDHLRKGLQRIRVNLTGFQQGLAGNGILGVSPQELEKNPRVEPRMLPQRRETAEAIAEDTAEVIEAYVAGVERLLIQFENGQIELGTRETDTLETARMYGQHLLGFATGCRHLFVPEASAVTHVMTGTQGATLRMDTIDLATPLKELIWEKGPVVCMSATLAVDERMDFFSRVTGAEPQFQEVLPSPFDFVHQAALYVPATGAIPDPTEARKNGEEESYFAAMAAELTTIIELMRGRTLALFHSRREMEEVFRRMPNWPELPILIQRGSGSTGVGDRFKRETRASLFALRSFWTGFDAPGETCSCVAVVRTPFEVPVDPAAVARHAWLETQGINPFAGWSLPNAKMMIRQGVGRLIRRAEDRGLICLLDPRLRTKSYGEEILENLPPGMREFSDVTDAIGWLGIE